MRKLFTIFALVAILGIATPALAGHNNDCPWNNPNCNQGGGETPSGGGDVDVDIDNSNDNSNRNSNLNTAFGGAGGDGGSATAGAIAGAGVLDSGNSNVDIGNGLGNFSPTAISGSDSTSSVGDISTSTNTSTSTSTEQGQGQGQMQGQVGIVKDGDVSVDSNDTVQVDASDNSVHSIDNDFPVNTAAPVFAGNCSQGVSAQTQGFGGSIASGNSVCDFIAVAGAFIAGGDRDNAFRVLGKAEEAADWRFFFTKIRMVITLGLL
jgi:hypothetical protein